MAADRLYTHTVTMEDGKRLPFAVIRAEDPRNAPLLVAFHGWTGGLNVQRDFSSMISPAHADAFPSNWNILLPQDRYGYARCGSWWLGEKGNLFMPRLLDDMIETVRQRIGFNGQIYTFGTSMGGFGAILHGLRWRARAICANVPQIRLLGTELDRRLIDFVFGAGNRERLEAGDSDPALAELARYADAINFLDPSLSRRDLPTFHIVQARHDVTPRYARDQCFHLINRLLDVDADFELHVHPEASHREYIGALEAIRWFEDKKEIIENGISNPLLSTTTNPNMDYASRVLEQYAREHGI